MNRSAWLALFFFVACGGTAVVDGDDGGSSTGTATGTSSGTATGTSSGTATGTASGTSSGTGDACLDGAAKVDEAAAEAQACNPSIDTIQCSGMTVVYDGCGCSVVANDLTPDLAAAAVAIFDDWLATPCSTYDCESCPPPPDSPWYCDPDTEQCQPAYE